VGTRTDTKKIAAAAAQRNPRRRPKAQGAICKVCGRPVARVARCRNQGGWRHVGPYKSDGHAPEPSAEQVDLPGVA
jgi:hypothetical protein